MVTALLACVLAAAPAAAQVIPHEEIAGYTVASSNELNFCFATTKATSAAGETMVYSFYKTNDGRRWHVAGYENRARLSDPTVTIGVAIDNVETLAARETPTQDGDFMLPFAALDEITGHEAAVETGETLTISIDQDDSLSLPLIDYRFAVQSIDDCLAKL